VSVPPFAWIVLAVVWLPALVALATRPFVSRSDTASYETASQRPRLPEKQAEWLTDALGVLMMVVAVGLVLAGQPLSVPIYAVLLIIGLGYLIFVALTYRVARRARN
jgi:hypothetical protein